MEIKDFNVGQKVFVLNMHTGQNAEPHIAEDEIVKIGRKYVTILSGSRYESCDWCEFGLYESIDWGDKTYLCPSITDANMLIEKRRLEVWINSLNVYSRGKYTFKQLKKVKEILDCGSEGGGRV